MKLGLHMGTILYSSTTRRRHITILQRRGIHSGHACPRLPSSCIIVIPLQTETHRPKKRNQKDWKSETVMCVDISVMSWRETSTWDTWVVVD